MPITSDCQDCLKPPRQHIASRKFSSNTPKHLFRNPEVTLHPKKANKTYFLDTVETFQKGAKAAKPFVPDYLWKLLEQLEPGRYQCVRVKEDSALPSGALYQTPLSAVVPLALAGAAHRRGLVAARNIVVLCDDIQEFMRHNRQANEQFLLDLAQSLDKQTALTFVGASQFTWNAKAVLGYERALPLGWD